MRDFFSPVRRRFAAVVGAAFLLIFSPGVCSAQTDQEPPAFNAATGVISNAQVVATQADGKILACRNVFSSAGNIAIVRFNADGSPDASFTAGDLGITYVSAILPLANGQILLSATHSDDTESSSVLLRLNADGSLDPTFPAAGFSYFGTDWTALPDGRILLTAYGDDFTSKLVRLNADGTTDAAFNAAVAPGVGFKVEADGDILVASNGDSGNDGNPPSSPSLARLGADGALKATIDLSVLTDGFPTAFLPLPDGKIVVALTYNDQDGNNFTRVFRLNADGTVDPAFDNTVAFDGAFTQLAAGGDGGLLAQGWFSQANGTPRNGLARLNGDGTLDPAYDPVSDPDQSIGDAVFSPSGELDALVTTSLTNSDGTAGFTEALEHFDAGGTLVKTAPLDVDQPGYTLVKRADGAGVYVASSPIFEFLPLAGVTSPIHPPPAAGEIISARPPVVTISAKRSKVYSGSNTFGKFILRRSGADLSRPLRVVYRVRGSAVPGQDYQLIRQARIIPAGKRVADITVRPVGATFDKPEGGRANVTIRLLPRTDYRLGPKRVAKVKLIDRAALTGP